MKVGIERRKHSRFVQDFRDGVVHSRAELGDEDLGLAAASEFTFYPLALICTTA